MDPISGYLYHRLYVIATYFRSRIGNNDFRIFATNNRQRRPRLVFNIARNDELECQSSPKENSNKK